MTQDVPRAGRSGRGLGSFFAQELDDDGGGGSYGYFPASAGQFSGGRRKLSTTFACCHTASRLVLAIHSWLFVEGDTRYSKGEGGERAIAKGHLYNLFRSSIADLSPSLTSCPLAQYLHPQPLALPYSHSTLAHLYGHVALDLAELESLPHANTRSSIVSVVSTLKAQAKLQFGILNKLRPLD